MRYEIAVHGCDDSTYITRELTDEQVILLQSVAEEITLASTYGCMPVMKIRPVPSEGHSHE